MLWWQTFLLVIATLGTAIALQRFFHRTEGACGDGHCLPNQHARHAQEK